MSEIEIYQWLAGIISADQPRVVRMRISYKLSQKDLLEAQAKHSGPGGKVLPIFGFFLFVAGLISLIHGPQQFPSTVAAMVMGIFFMFLSRLQVWFSFRRDNRLQDQFEATISDSGVDISNPKSTSKYDWSAFVRYAETKNLFMVYQAPRVFSVFPKRAFTAEQADGFRSLLDQRLGAASIAYRKKISPQTWVFLIVLAYVIIMAVMTIRGK